MKRMERAAATDGRAPLCLTRRAFFHLAAESLWLARPAAAARESDRAHGRIKPPIPALDLPLVRHDGTATTLPQLLNGHVTAVQLMFASCTTTCPIQGAIFGRVQKLIPDARRRRIQLLSLTVDPEHDTPSVMKAWLQRFKAAPHWMAAVPAATDVDRLRAYSGGGRSPSDNHTLQIQIFDRQGLLTWRTEEMPAAEEIARLLQTV